MENKPIELYFTTKEKEKFLVKNGYGIKQVEFINSEIYRPEKMIIAFPSGQSHTIEEFHQKTPVFTGDYADIHENNIHVVFRKVLIEKLLKL